MCHIAVQGELLIGGRGCSATCIGNMGRDAFGDYLRSVLQSKSIDGTGWWRMRHRPTTFALVDIDADGVPCAVQRTSQSPFPCELRALSTNGVDSLPSRPAPPPFRVRCPDLAMPDKSCIIRSNTAIY